MSEGERPTPAPRPRQSVGDETDASMSSSKVYENFVLPVTKSGSLYDGLNEQLSELRVDAVHRPVPAPRARTTASARPTVYENAPTTAMPLNNQQSDQSPSRSTGAIRKAPSIPSVKNNLDETDRTTRERVSDDVSLKDADVLSQNSSTSGKSGGDSKFATPSPGQIMKSIGSSSKMLTEAIGERISGKTSSAKHKLAKELKNTKNFMGSWTSDTASTTSKKLKVVRSKFDNFSLKRNKHKKSFDIEDERPTTFALGNDEMLQSLQFNSPMNNRCQNSENLPADASSTYEIPKSMNRRSSGDLPSYDQVVKDLEFLKRNTNLTQSLYSSVNKPNNLDKGGKVKNTTSDSQLHTISSESSSDDNDSLPPNIPAPELPEAVYGRIKKLPTTDYENAPLIPLRKPPPPPGSPSSLKVPPARPNYSPATSKINNLSDSSTICGSDRSLNDLASRKSLNFSDLVDRSESWKYVDNISQATVDSVESTEPIYANDENERMATSDYVPIFLTKTAEVPASPMTPLAQSPLTPLKVNNVMSSERKSQTLTREILNEFDPLSRDSFDAFITQMNHFTLLETLLSEETYGTIEENLMEAESEENSSVESMGLPTPPDRSDSLAEKVENVEKEEKIDNLRQKDEPGPAPKAPTRQKKVESRAASVIIHQNLKLHESVENLAEPYLAQVTDEPSTSTTVDLSRPKPPQTSWFVEKEESDKFAKNNLDNSNNFPHAPTDKLIKTVPQLQKVSNIAANREHLPTYEESKNDEIVNTGTVEKTSTDTPKHKSSLFNFGLRRRPSLKENRLEEKDFIPRPPFAEDSLAVDKCIVLFKLPSGVIEDMLKELNPRYIEVKKRQFKAFADSDFKVLKEHLDFTHLASIQYLVNHKFSEFKTESGRQIYCIEVNLAMPKNAASGSPSALLDSRGVPVKTQRVTYVYGIHSKNEKCHWMQKMIRSVTNVFPKEYSLDYIRAGWCYMKKSISSSWSGTWLMLSRRKLLFYDFTESRLEILDLRKARCIGLKESEDSTNNLLVEKGPTMLIDCPPFTCYFVMVSSRETKIWSAVIQDEAHANGTQLRHQQLTKDNVPVFVDKCINFIYTNGTMSEGIYRKAGSSTNIQKLITSLRKDAFSVQITRAEYNEHDVSSALKRFFRELPEPLMGKLAVSFLSVSEMKVESEKIAAYRELLARLPIVEYQTLKKLLGHLHFIQAQRSVNKMKAENLAMVFGPTLMQPNNNENQYQIDSRDNDSIAELIMNYKKLYSLTADEIKTEQIMLTVLQKYHSAAENLSDTVKQSGDFKIWITIDPNPELNHNQEDKKQVNVAVTPQKTVYELCRELETQMKLPAHDMTLMEIILNGELQRPLHYSEKVLNCVLRWANWPDDDRKTNYLELRPKTKLQEQVERALKNQPSFTPCMELKFADRKTKSMKLFTLELNDTSINVLKTEKNSNVKVKDFEVSNCIVYLGAEKKRDSSLRWALTFVELNFTKRSRDSPFIGHIIGGNNLSDQLTWYASIFYSLHGFDISPNPEIVMT